MKNKITVKRASKPKDVRSKLVCVRFSEDEYKKFERACGGRPPSTTMWEWATGKKATK